MKRIIIMWAALLFLSVSAAATDFYEFYAVWAQTGDEKITLMPSALRVTLEPGSTERLGLITRPSGLAVSWQSGDENICRVSDSSGSGCTLVGEHAGECRVTVSCGDASAAVQVVVKQAAAQISLSRSSVSISEGEVAHLRARVIPESASSDVTWQISPYNDCAAISYGGDICRIKGLDSGEFTVTASLPGGKSASAEVTVHNKSRGNGFRLTVALLMLGSFGLISTGLFMWRRRNEER